MLAAEAARLPFLNAFAVPSSKVSLQRFSSGVNRSEWKELREENEKVRGQRVATASSRAD
jgi:hypothetical protein